MALIRCADCGRDVSSNAAHCLGCGNRLQRAALPILDGRHGGLIVTLTLLGAIGALLLVISLFMTWFQFGFSFSFFKSLKWVWDAPIHAIYKWIYTGGVGLTVVTGVIAALATCVACFGSSANAKDSAVRASDMFGTAGFCGLITAGVLYFTGSDSNGMDLTWILGGGFTLFVVASVVEAVVWLGFTILSSARSTATVG